MPHILSSDALDLLFNLEMAGRAAPNDKVLFDGWIAPGTTETIKMSAITEGQNRGISNQPVLFLALVKLDNDPLLDTITLKYNFLPPIRPMSNTYSSRNASATLHTFSLPLSDMEIDLTADATYTAGVTVRVIYDVMSAPDAALFAQLGTQTLKETEALLQKIITEGRQTLKETGPVPPGSPGRIGTRRMPNMG